MLSQADFLKSLEDYDKDHIKDAVVRKLQKYVKDPSFTPDAVEKVEEGMVEEGMVGRL